MNKDKMGDTKCRRPILSRKKTITTNNLSEIAYLLDRGHQIVSTQLKSGTYGVEEFFITLEGENIDLDHKTFLFHGTTPKEQLVQVLDLLKEQIGTEEEAKL